MPDEEQLKNPLIDDIGTVVWHLMFTRQKCQRGKSLKTDSIAIHPGQKEMITRLKEGNGDTPCALKWAEHTGNACKNFETTSASARRWIQQHRLPCCQANTGGFSQNQSACLIQRHRDAEANELQPRNNLDHLQAILNSR